MLELSRPRPSWQGAAHEGTLTLPSGETQPVVALIGPESPAGDALGRARRAASVALSLRHPGVLRLVQVTDYDKRIAWCYESFEGLGLAHVVGSDSAGAPTARAAAELVAQIAEVLLALGNPGLHHPGPEPTDLVLGADGRVRIAGFAGPFPAGPAMRAPSPDVAEPAAVYRLGVLLATLVAGVPPAPATDATAHAVLVRRALIRAMARPGPVLSERYGQWIRGMLAWAPAERPPLSAVPAGLRSVGWATGGEGLLDWSARRVPELVEEIEERLASAPSLVDDLDEPLSDPGSLRRIAEVGPPPPRRPRPDDAPAPSVPTPTAQAPRTAGPPLRAHDDRTEEATLDRAPAQRAQPRQPRPTRPDAHSMPVDIGPPAEALARRAPSLPAGFLSGSDEVDEDSGPVAGEATLPLGSDGLSAWLIGAVGGLVIIGLVSGAYLVFGGTAGRGPSPSVDGPSLGGVLPEDVPPPVLDDGPAVPAPDLGALDTDTDTDLDTDTDMRLDTDEPLPDDGAAVPPAVVPPPDRPRDRGIYVRFRLAPGLSGTLGVRCDGRDARGGRTEYLEERLRVGQVCRVWAYDRQGVKRSEADVTVQGIATIDCFHGWSSDCLD